MRDVKKQTRTSVKSPSKLVLEKSAGAVVFYRAAATEYLLVRANHWEFPKGMIDEGESEEDAARREVREETGLDVILLPNFRQGVQYFYRRQNVSVLVKKQVIYFLGQATMQAYEISWEHQEARWVTYQQAMELLEYENVRSILQQAHDLLESVPL